MATTWSKSTSRARRVGRNDPCPSGSGSGSGSEYEKCCVDAAGRLDGRRVLERDGQRMLVSRGVSDAQLAAADEFFAAKAAGRGPAADIADYAEPLLDATDGSPEQVQRAMSMATVFWNLAIVKEDAERRSRLDEIVAKTFDTEDEREQFRSLARDMIERQRSMFPAMHVER